MIKKASPRNGSIPWNHPNDFVRYENGHLERFNRTIQEEMSKHKLCIFIKTDVLKFVEHYNKERMHMGIKFKTPAQMLN